MIPSMVKLSSRLQIKIDRQLQNCSTFRKIMLMVVVVVFEMKENGDDEEDNSNASLSNSYSRMMSSKVKLPSSFILGGGLA